MREYDKIKKHLYYRITDSVVDKVEERIEEAIKNHEKEFNLTINNIWTNEQIIADIFEELHTAGYKAGISQGTDYIIIKMSGLPTE